MTPEEYNTDAERVNAAVQILGEHFDTIQIFTTRHIDGQTVCMTAGAGNQVARRGQVREWMVKIDEDIRIDRRERAESEWVEVPEQENEEPESDE